jgi:hypothetical protein
MSQTTQDFVKRLDITGLTEVTGSEINQLLETALPATNKGMHIVTTDTALDTPDVPDPDTEFEGVTPTHWYRYGWVRKPFVASGQIKLYFWNEALEEEDATYLKWQEFVGGESLTDDITALQEELEELAEDITAAETLAQGASTAATTAQETADSAVTTANNANLAAAQAVNATTEIASDVETIENTVNTLQTSFNTHRSQQARVPLGVFIFKHLEDAGTDAGDSTDDWTKRELNDVTYSNSNLVAYATLVASVITLVAGYWEIEAEVPANGGVGELHHMARVKIGSSGYIYGSGEYCDTTYAATKSKIKGVFYVNAETEIEIQQIASAVHTDGYGKATGLATETYTQVRLVYMGGTVTP